MYKEKTSKELKEIRSSLQAQYDAYVSKNIALDMSRGKPGSEQLDLTMEMLNNDTDLISENGFDVRNYGLFDGMPEAKKLFGEMLGVNENQVLIAGNSSLNMMYDTISRNMQFGVSKDAVPWGKQGKLKFLCPSPGYDRHFAITQLFGFELVPVPMKEDGPCMDTVKRLVESDPTIKGIWCVPKFSNPTGIVYSDDVVRAFANLKPAANDFRIFWDNAYAVHGLYDEDLQLLNILDECEKAGNPDMAYMFASTSKISFPGSGIAIVTSSVNNMEYMKSLLKYQTIGFDKINQLRHVRFFKTLDGIKTHMKQYAEVLRPKFEMVLDILDRELGDTGFATWNKPLGGYFISLDVMPGTAKKTVALAAEAGIKLTPAGATFPYGVDPNDSNIRIAPTLPPLDELEIAANVLCISAKMAAIDKLLEG